MTKASGPTPMMAQYLGIKSQHPDAILLFRMGDFFETFYEDAIRVSQILGITLTSREKKGDEPIPLAGVPHHALDHYLAKLMDAGCTVAICEQTEDPSQAKGLVKREVVEVISPGTVTNPGLLRSDDSHYLFAICPRADSDWGYALLDGSTGEFRCGETSHDEILSLARRPGVTEILVPESFPLPLRAERILAEFAPTPVTQISPLLFDAAFASDVLQEHFSVHGLTGLGLADLSSAARAAGASLRYLADRQRSRPAQVRSLTVDRPGDALHLDRETVAHLELFESLRRGDRETTVFHHLNATRTPMGRRCLARWLRAPLCAVDRIEARLDAVQWLVDHPPRRDRVSEHLQGMGDLERVLGRVATGRVLPHELAHLRDGLARMPSLSGALEGVQIPLLRDVAGSAPRAVELRQPLAAALVEQPPTHLRGGGVFAEGHDEELDRLRELTTGGKQWVARYQESERARTGIGSLKVGYNKVFGYYLEVTNTHLAKVPPDYQEKQTLTSAKRFDTAELKEREQQILRAEDDRVAREAELFKHLVQSLAPHLDEFHAVVDVVAKLDALTSLAAVAASRSYVRPRIDEDRRLEISQGRHLVVERITHEPFVPNDVHLDPARRQILLLTGPNMGGKSTYLRQTALMVVLAQMGSFVPAASAHVGVVDRLFTRVGASDNLARGQSTFLVEMSETANILRNATDRSLVVLDEVGRGTSTDDGLALARAITEYLHDGPVRPKTLFATHFHQLTALEKPLARLANVQMEVREWEKEILFLHRVVPGASDRSYGVHVAQLAGVPEAVLRRAGELLGAASTPGESIVPPGPGPSRPAQLSLFTPSERQVLDRLRGIDPDRMRPLEALQLLAEVVENLRRA